MLSINIPIYNISISGLVTELAQQAEELDISFEIRAYDDGSDESFKELNRAITNLNNVVYLEMPVNLGRSAIRNKMGFESVHENILFLDADSAIVSKDFLKNYISNLKPDTVLCGGTCYRQKPPDDAKKMLRWAYGTNREAAKACQRNSKKGFIITSNNFLITKKVFNEIHFREEIQGYGHEDTLLGFDLWKKGIEIAHMDNPVEHTGLEDSDVFLGKTKKALDNLQFIANYLLEGNRDFMRQVGFLNHYSRIEKYITKQGLKLLYRWSSGVIKKNLLGRRPCLLLFDVYRIGYYSSIKNRIQ